MKPIYEWFMEREYLVGSIVGWFVTNEKIELFVKNNDAWEKVGELVNNGEWDNPLDYEPRNILEIYCATGRYSKDVFIDDFVGELIISAQHNIKPTGAPSAMPEDK